MSYATNDADVTGPRVDAAPRQSNVLRHGESWRSDELLSQPPKTYLGLGGSFCCALVLRIVVLILAVVALVLCIVTQVTKFYQRDQPVGNTLTAYTDYYLWWVSERDAWGGAAGKIKLEERLNGASVCLIIGLILSVISLAMAITYLVLLCVHHSARVRDDEEATHRYRARTEKLENEEAETNEMDAGAAPSFSTDQRHAAEDGLRREAHNDAAGLYERERKRRHADRGVWFTLLFALLATFILLLVGFIVAVAVYSSEYKVDEDDKLDGETSRMCEGVWIALVSWIMALVGFVLCVLRPCIRGQQETLTPPPAYSDMPRSQDLPTPSTRRGEFEPFHDQTAVDPPPPPPPPPTIATGVPMQPSAPQPDEDDNLPDLPIAENYATYHPEYGRGYYYDNVAGHTVNTRMPNPDKEAEL